MVKIIDAGFKKPTDPDPFSGGFETYSPPRSMRSTNDTSATTSGAATRSPKEAPTSDSRDDLDPNRPETEEDGERAGALRMARWKHQNAQLRGKGKKP